MLEIEQLTPRVDIFDAFVDGIDEDDDADVALDSLQLLYPEEGDCAGDAIIFEQGIPEPRDGPGVLDDEDDAEMLLLVYPGDEVQSGREGPAADATSHSGEVIGKGQSLRGTSVFSSESPSSSPDIPLAVLLPSSSPTTPRFSLPSPSSSPDTPLAVLSPETSRVAPRTATTSPTRLGHPIQRRHLSNSTLGKRRRREGPKQQARVTNYQNWLRLASKKVNERHAVSQHTPTSTFASSLDGIEPGGPGRGRGPGHNVFPVTRQISWDEYCRRIDDSPSVAFPTDPAADDVGVDSNQAGRIDKESSDEELQEIGHQDHPDDATGAAQERVKLRIKIPASFSLQSLQQPSDPALTPPSRSSPSPLASPSVSAPPERSASQAPSNPKGPKHVLTRCSGLRCSNLLSTALGYGWKMCEPCRVRAKKYQRQRKYGTDSGASKECTPDVGSFSEGTPVPSGVEDSAKEGKKRKLSVRFAEEDEIYTIGLMPGGDLEGSRNENEGDGVPNSSLDHPRKRRRRGLYDEPRYPSLSPDSPCTTTPLTSRWKKRGPRSDLTEAHLEPTRPMTGYQTAAHLVDALRVRLKEFWAASSIQEECIQWKEEVGKERECMWECSMVINEVKDRAKRACLADPRENPSVLDLKPTVADKRHVSQHSIGPSEHLAKTQSTSQTTSPCLADPYDDPDFFSCKISAMSRRTSCPAKGIPDLGGAASSFVEPDANVSEPLKIIPPSVPPMRCPSHLVMNRPESSSPPAAPPLPDSTNPPSQSCETTALFSFDGSFSVIAPFLQTHDDPKRTSFAAIVHTVCEKILQLRNRIEAASGVKLDVAQSQDNSVNDDAGDVVDVKDAKLASRTTSRGTTLTMCNCGCGQSAVSFRFCWSRPVADDPRVGDGDHKHALLAGGPSTTSPLILKSNDSSHRSIDNRHVRRLTPVPTSINLSISALSDLAHPLISGEKLLVHFAILC